MCTVVKTWSLNGSNLNEMFEATFWWIPEQQSKVLKILDDKAAYGSTSVGVTDHYIE